MSIPKMTTDLAIVQKLSDLPNSTDGLTAAQLKAKFDEGPKALQKWINETLIPNITALNIPFTASTEINANNVDGAIRAVYQQIRDAASGVLVDGSVTKAKLAEALLKRVYGGRPWVSLNTPGSAQNMAADFPIGQIWLRPAFTVANAAGTDWTTSGCTVAAGEDRFTITGNNTVMTVTATQTLNAIGQAGDRVYVLFGIENKDSEITGMSVSLNNGTAQDVSAGVFMTTLTGTGLTAKISVTWPATSLAGGSVDIVNYAVVNVDAILRQTNDAEDMTDWPGYLSGLLPLDSYASPAEVYIQTINGSWWPMVTAVLPLERGGLGLDQVSPGDLFYGVAGNKLERLPKPESDNRFLQYVGGKLQWVDADNVRLNLGVDQTTSGSYTGTGDDRILELPVTPIRLTLSGSDGSSLVFEQGTEYSERLTADVASGTYPYYNAYAGLSGNKLSFGTTASQAQVDAGAYTAIGNKSGVTYYWTAVY